MDSSACSLEPEFRIEPNAFYGRKDLEGILGAKGLSALRKSGLSALNGLYLGQAIIDASLRLCHARACQRGAKAGKEEKSDTGTTHQGYQTDPTCMGDAEQTQPAQRGRTLEVVDSMEEFDRKKKACLPVGQDRKRG